MRVEGEGVGPPTDDNGFDLLEGCNYLQGRSSEKSPLNKLITNQLMENSHQSFAKVSFTHYELRRKLIALLFLIQISVTFLVLLNILACNHCSCCLFLASV